MPRAALRECDLQQQELLVGEPLARDARIGRVARGVQRHDRVTPQRQPPREAQLERHRVGDRVGAREMPLDQLAHRARRERARGVVDGDDAARVQPLPRLGQHLVLAHRQLEPAAGAHRGAQLQQLPRQQRAREEALVEPDRGRRRPCRP